MSSSNDLYSMELLDDIESILFLCDRLNNRLSQVTSYVDEVKKTWIDRRRSVEADSNISPIIVQKAIKCNKILLSVAEKLAVVELQTESLHSLHTVFNNTVSINPEKHQIHIPTHSSTPPTTHAPAYTVPSNVSTNKTESLGNGFHLQQDAFSTSSGTSNIRVNLPTNNLVTRSMSSQFNQRVPVKSSVENLQSAFQRAVPNRANNVFQQSKLSPQNPVISDMSQYSSSKLVSNSSINDHLQRINNPTDSYSPVKTREASIIDNKVRVKMQVITSGTIWRHADIPIVDHPSAFFVSNQDPRVAEQFNMMSTEMNNYYSKPSNTTAPLQNISIGDFCVARFSEDNLWYRARVVLNNNESVLIVFIDYGNSESKAPNEIYPLIESLARLPAMTVACTLNEAFPSNQNFWTPEATDTFTMIVKNRIVEVHFQHSIDQQWPLHFVKVMLDGQSLTQHPKLAAHMTPARNEQIALHFNDKLTAMEYILYNVAVVDSDIYNNNLP